MLDPETKEAVRSAVMRVLDGRETVPGDLPFPPSISEYALAAAWPDVDPRRSAWTTQGRALTHAVGQVYVAGYLAGRECDRHVGGQVREALGISFAQATTRRHPRVGLAVCLVCDQAPDHPVHGGDGAGELRSDR